jgi:(2Fe-2S) ferredoxin
MDSAALPPLQILAPSLFKRQGFELTGTLQAWLQIPGERAKGFWLRTAQGDYRIKLSKAAWQLLLRFPQPPSIGTSVRVLGKCKQKDGKVKLKAEQLVLLQQECQGSCWQPQAGQPQPVQTPSSQHLLGKILICQKSDCCRRGGAAVKKAMLTHLEASGLLGQVEVKGTGCLGGCSKGPNLIVMPGKTRLNRLTPADVPSILAEHFPQTICQAVQMAG